MEPQIDYRGFENLRHSRYIVSCLLEEHSTQSYQFLGSPNLCVCFSGAAIYISLVEHPARMSCGALVAFSQWTPSYKRATVMQLPLAVLSTLFGLLSWWSSADRGWLAGALLIGAIPPFTFVAIKPTNDLLLVPGGDLSSLETIRLLRKWAQLHAVRSVLSICALVEYLSLLTKP
ncbi:hypothetical protein Gasu2_25790 [Galdieria sulphuraria]|nr:hypothetical protein Gasu2_25790 [Galdieria sulphuraria]